MHSILVEIILETLASLIELVPIFSSMHLENLDGTVKLSFLKILHQCNSCFEGVNLL